jgi:hypothetical protein
VNAIFQRHGVLLSESELASVRCALHQSGDGRGPLTSAKTQLFTVKSFDELETESTKLSDVPLTGISTVTLNLADF